MRSRSWSGQRSLLSPSVVRRRLKNPCTGKWRARRQARWSSWGTTPTRFTETRRLSRAVISRSRLTSRIRPGDRPGPTRGAVAGKAGFRRKERRVTRPVVARSRPKKPYAGRLRASCRARWSFKVRSPPGQTITRRRMTITPFIESSPAALYRAPLGRSRSTAGPERPVEMRLAVRARVAGRPSRASCQG